MQINITNITIYFIPPDEPMPARKPRTPIPLIDRIFRDVKEYFEDEETDMVEDQLHGTFQP